MKSLECTFAGHAYYNSMWSSTSFSTAEGIAFVGFGKDTYHRAIVIKVKTPAFSGCVNKSFQVQMLMCRASAAGAGTDTFNYRVTTETPSLTGSNAEPKFPETYICSGTVDVTSPSQNSGYKYNTIPLGEADIKPSATYYIWLWSDTPSWAAGYYANSEYYGGKIAITMLYEEGGAQIYNGSKWVPAVPYVYNGNTWVRGVPYVYNGKTWAIAGG